MAASADQGHLEEVRVTIATYLRAVKANDTATLRSLFDAKQTSRTTTSRRIPSSPTHSTSSWASFNRCTRSSTTPRRSARP
jgi:hypothetical protein